MIDEEKVVGEPLEVNQEKGIADGTLAGNAIGQETVVEPGPGTATVVYKKSEKKAGRRIGYYYIIVKSLKESKKNDVVKCFYIKSLTKWGYCVIKEGTYGDTKDSEGRDIKDRLLWQRELHERLYGKVRIPKLLDSFEENGNYYLVMEFLRGKPLCDLSREYDLWTQLDKGNKKMRRYFKYMLQIVDLVEKLHENGVVHRDATVNNFIILPTGKMALIDMELCYSLEKEYPSPAFRLGTYGFMSLQQEAVEVPTVAEDIFAVAAVILQMLTGISTLKLTVGSDQQIEKRVRYFIKDEKLSSVIAACLQEDAGLRPSLTTLRGELEASFAAMKARKKRVKNSPYLFSDQEIRETVQYSINTLAKPVFCDEEHGWFSEHLNPESKEGSKMQKTWYASYNRGVSGIIYFLGRAKSVGFDVEINRRGIDLGLSLIKNKYFDRPDSYIGGLHFGADGIAAALACAIDDGLLEISDSLMDWIPAFLEKTCTRNGIITGIAGQGMANLLCRDILPTSEIDLRLHTYAGSLLSKQQKNGSWCETVSNGKKYFIKGMGYGVAGIVSFLLSYHERYKKEIAFEGALKGLDWLKREGSKSGVKYWRSDNSKTFNYGWEEGSAGVALSFLKAYKLTGDSNYRDFARVILSLVPRDILSNGLSQYKGLSGLGETYLEAYHLLREEEWWDRATGIIQTVMYLRRKKGEANTYWLTEREKEPVANIMAGNTGILHFMSRYLYADKLKLPLMP